MNASKNDNWKDSLLRAHFQSLNPTWQEEPTVMVLLHDIRQFIDNRMSEDDPEARELVDRINISLEGKNAGRKRHPMKVAGQSDGTSSASTKAG